ncbi:phosphatidate cytidylyltransferase [Acholeplasma equirhinis]|uniref:phosphatidate cytidylyltransferase n=1 Tax=Acholeplasma equirhinis TaxID=555393 RepID=UPI00197AE4EB|nr:phosphatidate cytidylyltransferase [Acholeplasma equirhinis]MBN3491210.1 phosphatidate cytidylyltransferase [Acholeplasma equirhinis]
MKQRIITALILITLLIPVTVINHPIAFNIFQVLVFAFVIIGAFEMLSMFEKEKKMHLGVKITIVILTILTYMNVGGLVEPLNPITLPDFHLITIRINPVVVIGVVTLTLLAMMVFVDEFTGADIGKALTIINYVGLGAASIVLLRFLGVRFIVYVLLISTTTDIFAYFFGMAFGKHKLAPRISPKKSWEGAIAGTVFGTLIAAAFAIYYGEIFRPDGIFGEILNPSNYQTIFDNFTSLGDQPRWIQALIILPITLLGSVSAQIGDLVASKFKRTYQIKDFGNIMPGHGGVLDRFDSFLFIGLLFLSIFIIITQAYPLA